MRLFGFWKKDNFAEVFNEGLALYQYGRFSEAVDCFTQAIEIRDLYQVHYQRGMAFARLGQLSRAIEDFKIVVSLDAPDALKRDAYYNMGKAYDELQQPEESIHWYDKALVIDPSFANAYCNRGGVHAKLGEKSSDLHEFELALFDLNKGLALNPSDALAYFNRAVANQALQNYGQIGNDLRKFLELAPSNHPYLPEVEKKFQTSDVPSLKLDILRKREQQDLFQRIIEANNKNQFGEAIGYCDKYLQKNRLEATVWDEKAFALMCLERFEEALTCCDEGIAVNPGAARLYNTRALLLRELKRYREAIGAWEKYIALAPPEYAKVVAQAKANIEALRDFS